MSLIAASLISGGLGLLGGALNSQRQFQGYGQMDQLLQELNNSEQDLGHFQRLANESAPSQSDLFELAAATGGSNKAAMGQAEQMRQRSNDQALQQYGRYKQNLDRLRANLVTQKAQMQYGDFANRRGSMSSIFNNVAQMGLGYAANQHGFNQQKDLLQGLNNGGGGQINSAPSFNSVGPGVFNNNSLYGGFNTVGYAPGPTNPNNYLSQ